MLFGQVGFSDNIVVTFAVGLVQKETIKTGFSHKRVCIQEVLQAKKNM